MLIFLDTEFTDFGHNCEIISIGLIADSEEECYMEFPYEEKKCSEFVINNIVPLLGKYPHAFCEKEEARNKLINWFNIIKRKNEDIEICFDSNIDWELFIQIMNYNLPSYIMAKNIGNQINDRLIFDFLEKTKLPEHHALYDAIANKYAYRNI